MKKINRSASRLGLILGAGLIALIPAALAQDAAAPPPSAETVDAEMQRPDPAQLHPMAVMPMPAFSPNMSAPMEPIPGGVSMEGSAAELIGMRGDSDMMMIGAAVHGSFSDDQLEKIFKLKSEYKSKAGPKMAELKSLEMSLYDALTQPEMDKGKAQSIQGKINSLKSELADLRLEQRIGLLGTLTSEQRKELRRSFLKHVDFGCGMRMMGGRWGQHRGIWHHGHSGCNRHGKDDANSRQESKEERQTSYINPMKAEAD